MSGTAEPSLGLVLSGGGAAAFGHLTVLDVLDELGHRPAAIAGSSMGAVIGAAYASGMSARQIREHLATLFDEPLRSARRLLGAPRLSVLRPRGAFDPVKAVRAVMPEAVPDRIEDLAIPLTIMTTDYHGRSEIALTDGPLCESLGASIAIPGVFAPVWLGKRLCVDGGVTNNLPVAQVEACDLCIAVDAVTTAPSDDTDEPHMLAMIVGAMQIMMQTQVHEGVRGRANTVVIHSPAAAFGALDFHRFAEIMEAADTCRNEARTAIRAAVDQRSGRA